MNFAGSVSSWLQSLPGPTRALVSAIAVVLIVGIIPQTRKYAIWIGGIILIVWISAYFRSKGSS